MHHAAGDITAHRDSVLKRLDGQAELHPRVDRVPDDPAAEHVPDRAEIQLALGGAVFGDVGEPQLVRGVSSEDVPGPAVLVHYST